MTWLSPGIPQTREATPGTASLLRRCPHGSEMGAGPQPQGYPRATFSLQIPACPSDSPLLPACSITHGPYGGRNPLGVNSAPAAVHLLKSGGGAQFSPDGAENEGPCAQSCRKPSSHPARAPLCGVLRGSFWGFQNAQ